MASIFKKFSLKYKALFLQYDLILEIALKTMRTNTSSSQDFKILLLPKKQALFFSKEAFVCLSNYLTVCLSSISYLFILGFCLEH